MALGKDEVVEVLSDFRIRSIRFSAGPVNVNVEEYDRVSDFVDSGAIKVKPTKSDKRYVPKANTLFLIDGDSRNDINIRSGVLHECTHIIADINKASVTRLHDEAAAYLAQFTFLKLLDPSYDLPMRIIGNPLDDLVYNGLGLVAKYKLGQPEGFGAIISATDIHDLGHYVQKNPDYSKIADEEGLDADGVDLTEAQAAAHFKNRSARAVDKAKYEAWLLSNMNKAAGSGTEKAAGYGMLFNHFFMVYQPEATILLYRLSALKSGDPLSERFHSGLNAQQKHDLLEALRVPKPPG
jgi:hypothetical protein